MMNMAPIFMKDKLQLSICANSTALRTTLSHWCYSHQNFGASLTVSAGNGPGADVDNQMQVDSLMKGKETGKGNY